MFFVHFSIPFFPFLHKEAIDDQQQEGVAKSVLLDLEQVSVGRR